MGVTTSEAAGWAVTSASRGWRRRGTAEGGCPHMILPSSSLPSSLPRRGPRLIRLIGLPRLGKLESDAAGIVLALGGLEVEVGEGDFAGVSGGEIEEGCADDGVVSDFESVTVLEDQRGGGGGGLGRGGIGAS